MPRYRFAAASQWFVNHGWVVVVPMRRRYTGSDGDCVEGTGGGDDPDFYLAGYYEARGFTRGAVKSIPGLRNYVASLYEKKVTRVADDG